jgi:hypothetical protein
MKAVFIGNVSILVDDIRAEVRYNSIEIQQADYNL